MSTNKMLIDASHPEETRVVVLKGGRVEEFDFESAARKLLRGNIYLAKVTRVEPSLQAAFIDYGGNRHGFLAFNEIHPDYYQIPMADRQALLAEDAADDAAEEAEVDARSRSRGPRNDQRGDRQSSSRDSGRNDATLPNPTLDDPREAEQPAHETVGHDHSDHGPTTHDHESHAVDVTHLLPAEPLGEAHPTPSAHHEVAISASPTDERIVEPAPFQQAPQDDVEDAPRVRVRRDTGGESDQPAEVVEVEDAATEAQPEQVESLAEEDALEELPARPRRRPRSYKIQEVMKRRQVVLIQVVKEERGNKGAALTTYLSLAGRYTVLMPNTARGGGISRKITNPQDRKRLKEIADELEVPEGMGLIIRTAGAARTKQEIKRDFEYLLRLWESVRDLTLQSVAPVLVYEEGNLVKRSIRDLYSKEIDEIVVAGEPAHREALDFMSMLMPSHAKNVIMYAEPEPLFARYGIERQLAAMFSPQVTLKSGGYIVINQTEALVAIDVNSGKSTREYSIEETALATNLEASDEIARQLKLRDLAGLIVIDFIDMEEKRNNRSVERRVKDALRFDRARIQLGRISHFGLMEMSRQRLRTGVLEGSSSQCPHCTGTGVVRSTESLALAVIRGIEDELARGSRAALTATTSSTVALYILNHKRGYVIEMERRHGVAIDIQASDKMQGANFVIEAAQRVIERPRRAEAPAAVSMSSSYEGVAHEVDEVEDAPAEITVNGDDRDAPSGARSGEDRGENDDQGRGRRRRRPRRDGRPDDDRGSSRGGQRGGYRSDQRGERPSQPRGSSGTSANSQGEFATAPQGNDEREEPAYGGDLHEFAPAVGDGETPALAEGADRPRQIAGDVDPARLSDDSNGRRGRRRGRRGGRRGRERGDGQPADQTLDRAEQGGRSVAPDSEVTAGDSSSSAAPRDQAAPRRDQRPDGRRDFQGQGRNRGGAGPREGGRVENGRRPRFRDSEGEARPQAEVGMGFAANFAASVVSEPVAEPHLLPQTMPASPQRTPAAQAPQSTAHEPSVPVVAQPSRSRRSEPTSSEPVIERVRVGPDRSAFNAEAQNQAHAQGGEPHEQAELAPKSEPQRKGWWQRNILGG